MSRTSNRFLAAGALIAAFALLCAGFAPEKRVVRYVKAHQAELQAAIDDHFQRGRPLSYSGDIPVVNDWSGPGQHPMIEYLLFAVPFGYYGFYCSPDGVPLAFQNTDCPLSETATGWQ